MDRTEVLNLIQAIGTCEDVTEIRESLATLQEEVNGLFDSNESLTQTNETLTGNNEKLREANMKLFLRVGESKDSKTVQKDSTGIQDDQIEKLKFEDLFDEKGGLK
jgi:regulator of replication initiation timing